MSRQHRNTHLYNNGSSYRCHNNIVCRCRNAHSEHDAAKHCKNQRKEGAVLSDGNERIDKELTKSGHCNNTRNQTCHSARRRNADGVFGSVFKRADNRGGVKRRMSL